MPVRSFIDKVIQLYDTIQVRHGLMLVGPTGGGKTSTEKVLSQAMTSLEKKGQAKRVMMERDILTSIDHTFLIGIHASFQTENKLFLVLEYCPGG